MEAAVEVQQKAGRNRQLTERDRELCGFLAVCRYLTREQIERLMFPGRSEGEVVHETEAVGGEDGRPGSSRERRSRLRKRRRVDGAVKTSLTLRIRVRW